MEKKKKSGINLGEIIRKLIRRKWTILCVMILSGALFGWLITCVPRYYTCEVSLAPEFSTEASAGSLASIASSFGISVGSGANSDAISPSLYPDLMESKDFVVSLFPIKIQTQDGKIKTDYYTYLKNHQQKAWWDKMFQDMKKSFKKLTGEKPKKKYQAAGNKIDPFYLSEDNYRMAEGISKRITCSVDRRNYVITIRVMDQDPLVCATMADSVRCRLQSYITNYRTNKARIDVEYYEKLVKEAKIDYDKASDAYSQYADSHHDMIMQSYISERDELENDMQTKFSVYNAVKQQLEGAKAKLQECTPAFTTLKIASVPSKPTGPKRVMFVLGMLILTFFVTSFVILKGKDIANLFKSDKTLAKENKNMFVSGMEPEETETLIPESEPEQK